MFDYVSDYSNSNYNDNNDDEQEHINKLKDNSSL